jgi:hypothetical protein
MGYIKHKSSKSADFIIRVTSVNNATWQGKVEHVHSGQAYHYQSLLELVNQIHYKLETFDYPQSDTQLRSWGEDTFFDIIPGKLVSEQTKEQENPLPAGSSTFLVRILYRQNTTWQGTIQSLDKKKTVPFRSLLELVMLINEAVSKNIVPEEG